MPKSKSVLKRERQNEKRRLRNKAVKTLVKTMVRRARESLASNNLEKARVDVHRAVRQLDKASEHGILHRNTTSRKKSRLMKKLAKLENAKKVKAPS